MPNAPLLAFLAAAQVATSTAPDPDAAARATWLMPLVAALPVGVGLAGVGPGNGGAIAMVGASVLFLGPGAGNVVAGDPKRGALISLGGLGVPLVAVGFNSLGNFLIPQTTCAPTGNCDPAFPLVPILTVALGLGLEFAYYKWAADDAYATAKRRSLEGAALPK
jgi:hypothetical protein